MIYKQWWFWIIILILLAIIGFFGYKYYIYSKCKKEEGNICGGNIPLRDISGENIAIIPVKIKCNFWKGKICN